MQHQRVIEKTVDYLYMKLLIYSLNLFHYRRIWFEGWPGECRAIFSWHSFIRKSDLSRCAYFIYRTHLSYFNFNMAYTHVIFSEIGSSCSQLP